jgi:predicted phage baseplate assembly protein
MSRPECCTPPAPARDNPPGQPALRYRAGTWATFRAAMIARLPGQTVPPDDPAGARPLAALTARDAAEPTIALLDAAACALDVLTFYQERHLNEGFLGTATERASLAQIARALGYEPGPGQAASGWLAFTTSTLAVEPVTVPVGTAVMALPEGSTPPPVFETVETIEARREWNALPVARRLPAATLVTGTGWIWVDGVETRARPGDGVLLYGQARLAQPGSERWDFRRLSAVEVDAAHRQTRLVFERGLGDATTSPPGHVSAVLIFRNRASVFGHNAPDWRTQSTETKSAFSANPSARTEWPGFALAADRAADGLLDLDREYPGILPGSWVVLVDTYHVEAYEVAQVSPAARVDFTLTARVSRLKLRGEHLAWFDRRGTTVWCEPDVLTRVGEPDSSPVQGASVVVDGAFGALQGRMLAVYGDADDDGTPRGEVVRVASAAEAADGTTALGLDPPLASAYARDTVVLNANVAPATHGQTAPAEVLGSGNAAQPSQSFVLKGKPLTHVPSPAGRESTLTVRVGGVEWTEVPFLHGQPPDARVYRLRHAADGTTLVEFGDGVAGARLPTGQENVVAAYRTGLGLAGEVAARRASLLTRRPTGVDGAINPTAFTGAADPDDPEQIRTSAPRTVLTLDRLVSLQDYEDFARAFDGIGKALAAALWDGQRRLVHLTVASASGMPPAPADPILVNLAAALRTYQDPVHQVAVDSYQARAFGLRAWLLADPAHAWETVLADARAALAAAFDFAHRQFGQSVAPAEVVSVLQAVEGVVAVDLDRIFRTDDPAVAAPPNVLLQARGPQSSGGARQTAELLLVSSDPADVGLERMPP